MPSITSIMITNILHKIPRYWNKILSGAFSILCVTCLYTVSSTVLKHESHMHHTIDKQTSDTEHFNTN